MRRSGFAIGVCVCVGAVLIPAIGRSQSQPGSVTSSVVPVAGQQLGPVTPPAVQSSAVGGSVLGAFSGVPGKDGGSDPVCQRGVRPVGSDNERRTICWFERVGEPNPHDMCTKSIKPNAPGEILCLHDQST
jgi:hypothetical protein